VVQVHLGTTQTPRPAARSVGLSVILKRRTCTSVPLCARSLPSGTVTGNLALGL
jgi:hypothetical protein